MVFKVGLTGGIASGKTTVSNLFAKLGIEVIDADVIARKLLQQNTECYQQVLAEFGNEVLMANGDLNRPWLRERIFNDDMAKKALEAIVHPAVRERILQRVQNINSAYCIISVPLLIEAQMQDLVDRTLLVDLLPETQLERLMQRDKVNQQQAQAMLNGQASREDRLQFADDIIDNNSDPKKLDSQIHLLHHQYMQLASANS